MSRYIQHGLGSKEPKPKKPREMPKVGSYSVKDLKADGVKSGLWEKKDG